MIPQENIRSSYRYYKLHYEKPIHRDIYIKIVVGFMAFIVKKVAEGFFVRLSGGDSLGTIGVRGKKARAWIDKETDEVKGAKVNWYLTTKLWKENPEAKAEGRKIYYLNEHTNGIRYKLVWLKEDMKLANKNLYTFRPCHSFSQAIYKEIMKGREFLITERKKFKRNVK